MAVTKCGECGTEISATVVSCLKCGAIQLRILTGRAIVVAVAVLAVVAIVATTLRGSDNLAPSSTHVSDSLSVNTSTSTDTIDPATTAPELAPEPADEPKPGAQWSYSLDEDPMGKGNTRLALVSSSNTVEFSPPYDGPQRATLRLRTHPRYGKDVFLSIERGQFLCRSYEDCRVLVRFDDQKASSYTGIGASDNSTETIFIRNYPRFVASMLKAKRVRISAEIYQEGTPVFEFDVTGFDKARYNPKE